MRQAYKPDTYTSVSPYLIVNGADKTTAFLERALGARPLRRIAAEDGKVIHAEVRIDDTVVMIADATEGWSNVPAHVHVYVPDVDAAYQCALDAGATSVHPPLFGH